MGCRSWCRLAKGRRDSDWTPVVVKIRNRWAAAWALAAASSDDLPIPAGPRSNSAPPPAPLAAAMRSLSAPTSWSRPISRTACESTGLMKQVYRLPSTHATGPSKRPHNHETPTDRSIGVSSLPLVTNGLLLGVRDLHHLHFFAVFRRP